MFVISRNKLVTPVEMVGADKINKATRSALYRRISGPHFVTKLYVLSQIFQYNKIISTCYILE